VGNGRKGKGREGVDVSGGLAQWEHLFVVAGPKDMRSDCPRTAVRVFGSSFYALPSPPGQPTHTQREKVRTSLSSIAN